MLPFIIAAVLAAAAAAYAMSGEMSTDGPKHAPGGDSEARQKRAQDEARRQAEEEVQRRIAQEREQQRQKEQKVREQAEKAAKEDAEKIQRELEAHAKAREEEFQCERERLVKEAVERAKKAEEERQRREREGYPMPDFLATQGGTTSLNWAVFGDAGQGKSSLINVVMDQKNLAKTGAKETTMAPTPYTIHGIALKIWDLPGAGTAKFPKETYVRKMGLRYFDFVFVVSAGRWKEHDMAIIEELKKHQVPHFVIRTKVDVDIENEIDDNDVEPEATVQGLREECEAQGVRNAYFITTKSRQLKRFGGCLDNKRLQEDIHKEIMKDISRSSLLCQQAELAPLLDKQSALATPKGPKPPPVPAVSRAQRPSSLGSPVASQSRNFVRACFVNSLAKAMRRR